MYAILTQQSRRLRVSHASWWVWRQVVNCQSDQDDVVTKLRLTFIIYKMIHLAI